MIETKKKRKKKGSISEEDVSLLLQRYTATTIIVMLQEVAQFADVKIDWNTLVKKTSTGITNAREYQMLWRHLAYREKLIEKLEDEAEPLDDDSDLEYELEAFPPVSSEAATEAAACVKVLIASGSQNDPGPSNCSTVEGPLTINIPNGQALVNPQIASSTQGTHITVPVSVQKQPLSTVASAEGLDGNGSVIGGLHPRRKRKLWTEVEDMELIAAVQKCGEGNWANILKGDFKGDRTASQLSQRWAIIRKRKAHSNVGGTGTSSGSQLSEAQLAARRAVSLALNMPMMDSLTAAAGAHSSTPSSSTSLLGPVEASMPLEATPKPAIVGTSFSQALHQSQQRGGASSSLPKARLPAKKPSPTPLKPSVGPNPLVQAAAVAAGARIATPSTAASLLKAAQSKNAVHIRPGGSSLIKASPPASTNISTSTHVGPRPNVHYIRTVLASSSPPNHSVVGPSLSRPSQQPFGTSMRPPAPKNQLPAITGSSATPQIISALCDTKENAPMECVEDDLTIVTEMEAVAIEEETPKSQNVGEPVKDLPVSERSNNAKMALESSINQCTVEK